MSAITTHVLDTARGCPAAGVPITLELQSDDGWIAIGQGATDGDGRLKTLLADGKRPAAGIYRISFDTDAYFRACGIAGFYPSAQIAFRLSDPDQHYHVPLLLSPFGYSTYRGS